MNLPKSFNQAQGIITPQNEKLIPYFLNYNNLQRVCVLHHRMLLGAKIAQ